MRNVLNTFITAVVLGICGFFLFVYPLPTVCDSTISFRVGKVDRQFNIPEEQLLQDIKEAVRVWNDMVGKQLIVYDPKSDLEVNLVFDERQSLSQQIQSVQKETLESKSQLDSKLEDYKRRSGIFEERLRALNQEIDEWNSRGGAPEDVYNKLKEEEVALQKEADSLNALASELNLNVGDYNAKVDVINQTEETLSHVLEGKPEAGLYDPQDSRIDVYFNTSQEELTHTLQHEFGHVLGLNHVSNPKAIMFSKSSIITRPAAEDEEELKNRCKKMTFFEKLQSVLKIARTGIDASSKL